MAKPTIEILIDENGDTKITVKDARGAECESLTKELEADLGVRKSHRRTADFYKQSQTQERRQTQ